MNSLNSKLFSSYKYSIHVPSFFVQKLILYRREESNDNNYLIFHPYSLSFIEADLHEAQIIKLLEERIPYEKIEELFGTRTIKVIKDLEELIEHLNPNDIITFNKPTVLWVLTSPFCNMRCRYCYTSSGSVFRSNEKMLDDKEIINAISKILDAFPSINHIAYFGGGEPLLNLKLISKISETFEDLVEDYSIVTNGTLISREFVELVKSFKGRFWITLSIDGPKIVHDINRIYPNGKGTYDDIIKNIKLLKEEKITFDIQATYTYEALMLGYSMTDIAYFLGKISPYIMLKPSDFVPSLGAGKRFIDANLGYMLIDYVINSIREMLEKHPRYYDLVMMINIAQLGRKALKKEACPYTSFITLNADGRIFTCHMLTDYPLGRADKVNKKELQKKYNEASSILKKYTSVLDPRDFWMLSVQDICPAELFNGLSRIASAISSKEKLRLNPYIKSVLESYWDSVLVKLYDLYRRNELTRIYDRIAHILEMRRKGSLKLGKYIE